MKEYECPNAIREGTSIRCRAVNDYCGNVYFCRMAGRWKLTEGSVKCPVKEPPKKRGKKNG